MQFEPFAVQLYHQVVSGWDEREIAVLTGIPVDRVRQRVRAAEGFLRERGRPFSTGPDKASSQARAAGIEVRVAALRRANNASRS